MERHFDQQLEKLKTRLIKMCSLVDEQVELAFRSIEEGNIELANLVIERDNKVDKYDIKIDKICQKLLALSQPVASDLRLIMSALAMNSNLERMGDIAVNIAKKASYFKDKPEFFPQVQFPELALAAKELVHNSIDSFIDFDAELAKKVMRSDNRIDDMTRQRSDLLISIMKDNPDIIEPAIKLYSMMYQIERLGDHSTNIAETVYFIVEAQLIKHRYEEILFNEDKEEDDDDEAAVSAD